MLESYLILVLRQQFIRHANKNFQTRQYKKPLKLFFISMINIKNFDPNLLNIDQISFKNTDLVIYPI